MKMRLHISYDGTDFYGWQRQKTITPTVQGSIESALSQLFDTKVTIVGSGRTDAGVHALHQVAHFKPPKDPAQYKFVRALNRLTPTSISIKEAFIAPDDFHAQNSATHKTYKYRILNREVPSAVRSRYTTWVQTPLDLNFLNQASQYLLGEQDFASFQSAGTETLTTVRTILDAKWTLQKNHTLEFTITGTGFLKQMVRNIVGTLLQGSFQGVEPDFIQDLIEAKNRMLAGPTAQPHGLFLYHVYYPSELDNRCRKL